MNIVNLEHGRRQPAVERDSPREQAAVDLGIARPHDPAMSNSAEDVAVLKYRAEQADKRMDRMEGKLDQIIASLSTLATKRDLDGWRVQWIAIGLAAVAVIVGGVIGGLDWIKTH